jgi:dihydrofolate reductase
MRTLTVFNHVTLDGCFVDAQGSMNWARHGNEDPEYAAFVARNASGNGELLFGRVTYDMMAAYWPTPVADQHMPEVARGMNASPKVVFSHTLSEATWKNTRLLKGDLLDEVRKLKAESGPGMCILGSGSIVAQLAPPGLIDEYQVIFDPVALGGGRSMFHGMPGHLHFRLAESRTFKNGKVFLKYHPA